MVIPLTSCMTQQAARKDRCPSGCVKFERLLCCIAWLRRMTTTCAMRRAIISNLTATRFMVDLFRGSLSVLPADSKCMASIAASETEHALRQILAQRNHFEQFAHFRR